jgi:hypothetical protein
MDIGDTLKSAGPGEYSVVFDVESTRYLDIANHSFVVEEAEDIHNEIVGLPLTHESDDTAYISGEGTIELTVQTSTQADSAVVFYKDIDAKYYDSVSIGQFSDEGVFAVEPRKDGSRVLYYFRVFVGEDIYGYEEERYDVFIAPDTSRLSKYEVVPSPEDEEEALMVPAEYTLTFFFKGYNSSAFIPDTTIDPSSITWKLADAQGCKLQNTSGLETEVVTTGNKTSSPVKLIVMINTKKTKLIEALDEVDTIPFNVSGTTIDSIVVRRIDAGDVGAISNVKRAQFVAEGYDTAGELLAISPQWQWSPQRSGEITSSGVFIPEPDFFGTVRIFADAGGKRVEYNPRKEGSSSEEYGLNVLFMLRPTGMPDTATNNSGCTILFPKNLLSGRDIAHFELRKPVMENLLKRVSDSISVIVDACYTVSMVENVALNTEEDSMLLILEVPGDSLKKKVKANRKSYKIGKWDEDSLKWDIVQRSKVADDGKKLTLTLGHFSQYGIVFIGNQGDDAFWANLDISPNPFSPYVEYEESDGMAGKTYRGTRIGFECSAPEDVLNSVSVGIYTMMGDLVWAVRKANVNKFEKHAIRWDGKTSGGKEYIWESGSEFYREGERMCRNGRYFVVLYAERQNREFLRTMKQMILVK